MRLLSRAGASKCRHPPLLSESTGPLHFCAGLWGGWGRRSSTPGLGPGRSLPAALVGDPLPRALAGTGSLRPHQGWVGPTKAGPAPSPHSPGPLTALACSKPSSQNIWEKKDVRGAVSS